MKKLKVNLMMVLALVIGVATMSFKLANNDTKWHFTGNNPDEGQYRLTSNWELGASGSSCASVGDFPCEIEVDAQDKTELGAILSGMTNDDVLDINPTSKRD